MEAHLSRKLEERPRRADWRGPCLPSDGEVTSRAGVDGMTVRELYGWLIQHKQELLASLLDGSYQPQPVRGVESQARRECGNWAFPRFED